MDANCPTSDSGHYSDNVSEIANESSARPPILCVRFALHFGHSLVRCKLIRLAIVNSKGGSGKTTLTVNLASWLASRGERVAIVDYDPQASSLAWLARRPASAPKIIGIKAHDLDFRITRSYRLVDGLDVSYLLMDTPAAIAPQNLIYFCRDAHRVLVPVLPSAIDSHSSARLVQDLLLRGGLRQNPQRLAIVASRVRHHTKAYDGLQRFLRNLNLPVIATVRDSQNYIRSAELGIGVAEMPAKQNVRDLPTWQTMDEWLQAVTADVLLSQEPSRPTAATGSHRIPITPRATRPTVLATAEPEVPRVLRADLAVG